VDKSGDFPGWHHHHYGSPHSRITWGMNRRPICDCGSETCHPISWISLCGQPDLVHTFLHIVLLPHYCRRYSLMNVGNTWPASLLGVFVKLFVNSANHSDHQNIVESIISCIVLGVTKKDTYTIADRYRG
jgi:hypothetical protein